MYIYYLGLVGVFVFAISGALAADRRGNDWIGVLVLAFATALGGGTLRDILLQRNAVFWIADPTYVYVVIAGAAFTIVYVHFFKPPTNALLFADALGLAMFSVLGAKIAENMGEAPTIAVLMGIITGVAGGIIRDVLVNEIPFIFRSSEPLYSVAAAAGVIVYIVLKHLGVNPVVSTTTGVVIIVIARFVAIIWKIKVPEFNIRKR